MNKRKIIICYLSGLFLLAVTMVAGTQTEVCAKKKVLPKKIKVTGKSLDKKKMSLDSGSSGRITYTVSPAKATNKKVAFSSSDKTVAKVTSKGVVKGVKAGTATITIRSKAKKSVKAKVNVTVKNKENTAQVTSYNAPAAFAPPATTVIDDVLNSYLAGSVSATAISLDRDYIELAAGESDHLIATLVPATATNKVTWTISPLGGINIYQNGNIFVTEDTPPGTTAVVTAQCRGLTATCTIVVKVGACEHTWGDWVVTTLPTCMMEGIQTSTCSKCGKTREQPAPATGHSWLARPVSEPTCTEVGETEYTCQNPGCTETRMETVKAKGHTWAPNGEVLELPTCTKRGKTKYTCTIQDCGAEEIRDTDALGHTWDATGEVTKSPTCSMVGIRTYHCTVDGCDGKKNETIPAMGHTWTYGDITAEPACTKTGKRLSVCLNCSARTVVSIPAFGHDWDMDNGKVTKEPKCEQKGIMTYECKTCQATKNDPIDKLGHDMGPEEADRRETCTKSGEYSKHCQRDKCTYRTDIRKVKATGHNYREDDPAEGTIETDPTCTSPGVRVHVCNNKLLNLDGTPKTDENGNELICGSKKRVVLSSLGHNWSKDYITEIEPTCTMNGREALHCLNAGCTKTKNVRSVPILGHDWDVDNPNITAATCTTEGKRVETCKRPLYNKDGTEKKDDAGNVLTCGMNQVIILPPLGHQFPDSYTIDAEPNCNEPGRRSKHCTNTWEDADGNEVQCTVVSGKELIPPLGHQWGAWSVVQAPSHGVAGREERQCAECKATQSRGTSEEHVYDESGKCSGCGETVTFTDTVYSDWEYALDDVNGEIVLKKYIGTKDGIRVPKTLEVKKEDGSISTYNVRFDGGYEPRTQTSIFASNKKCDIKAVQFADGVKITNMDYMFCECVSLQTVLGIPQTVTSMKGTFKNCTSLVSVGGLPDEITELVDTFSGCTSLTVAPKIPAKVTSLYGTFKGCEGLAAAPVLPNGVTNLSFTFNGCKGISVAPALPITVTEMTDTFRDCDSLIDVPEDIPAGVTKLITTFYGCDALEKVPKLPSTITMMKATFMNCKNLAYAEPLPRSVVKQEDVFTGCDKLVLE